MILRDLRVIEGASFVAAPSCGMHLAQMGAEVIRFDMIGGGPDFGRWPLSPEGRSFFWEGLNKGKKSIALDLRRPEGRELAVSLVTAPGQGAGIFVTNFPADGFLSHARLATLRPDLITARIMGHADGRQAVDYTVNNAVGLPFMTGPEDLGSEPVNHVLPAWDLLAGAHATFSLLAAERMRRDTGHGQEIRLPLSDLAMTTLGALGQIAEVSVSERSRPRYGNALFGAFGRDFETADGRRVMLVAITEGQWSSLLKALGIGEAIAAIERELSVSFARDEGMRFIHRDRLFPVVAEQVRRRSFEELASILDAHGVCWSPYRQLHEALRDDPDFSSTNPVFSNVAHPSGHSYLTPASAASFSGIERMTAVRAPRLGEHTEEVLTNVLGLDGAQIADLHDRGLVASS
jgi:2-methylfumaryl-CoA isomerase